MRQTRLALIFSGIAAAAVMAGILIWMFQTAPSQQPPSSSAAPATTVAPAPTTAYAAYTLGVWEGRLALFLPGSEAPDEVYDVFIASLPDEEQEKLTRGIPVPDQQTLERLLEDYTS